MERDLCVPACHRMTLFQEGLMDTHSCSIWTFALLGPDAPSSYTTSTGSGLTGERAEDSDTAGETSLRTALSGNGFVPVPVTPSDVNTPINGLGKAGEWSEAGLSGSRGVNVFPPAFHLGSLNSPSSDLSGLLCIYCNYRTSSALWRNYHKYV